MNFPSLSALLMFLCLALPGTSRSREIPGTVLQFDGKTVKGTVVFGDQEIGVTDQADLFQRIPLADIDKLTLTPPVSASAEAGILPQGWKALSYGSGDFTGFGGGGGNTFALSIDGEGGHFIYLDALPAGEIVVRLDQLSSDSAAGIQIRARRDSSKTAALRVDAEGMITLTARCDAEEVQLQNKTAPGAVTFPCWLKLQRSVSGFTGLYSSDGEHWRSLAEELKLPWWKDAFSPDDDEDHDEGDDLWELRVLAGLFLESDTPRGGEALFGDVQFRGAGLKAEYFEGHAFKKHVLTRAESSLLHDWGSDTPLSRLGQDDFSIRWTAELIPRRSGPHEFIMDGDDAVRFWIDDEVIAGDWPGLPDNEGIRNLTAGQSYSIRVDYYEVEGDASVHLRMREPSLVAGKEIEDEPIPIEMLRHEISGDSMPITAAPAGLLLKDGSFLAGQLVEADADAITIAENARVRRTIDRFLVASIVVMPTAGKSDVANGRLGARMIDGDFFEGRFDGASDGEIRMSSLLFGQQHFPQANRVAEIILAPPDPSVEQAQFTLTTLSGSRWKTNGNPVISPRAIAFEHTFLGEQKIPVKELIALERASAPVATSKVEDSQAPFPEPYNTEKSPGIAQPPKEAAAGVRLPEGFEAHVYASEPEVRQPAGMCFDAKGRLWVAEFYTYGETAVNFADDLRDRIVILADRDGDGAADARKIFWDAGHQVTSVLPANGGVYVLAAPQMLFIPDKNGDDVPDGPPEVLLDGFDDDEIRHNIVNGLKWGPDGWIYGRHGIQEWSKVGPPNASDEERVLVNCCIWRYHPLRKDFEVVCEGGTNSWGWDYNAEGEMFFINTVIGHFWHAIPGAFYKRMYGEHRRDHLYEWLDHHADHVHWATGENWNDASRKVSDATSASGGGHAHTGLLIYQGMNFPNNWQGRALTINFHGRRLNTERLEATGSGFTARHMPDFAQFSDPWFRGVELLSGPDGAVYVADWSDTGECHDNDGVNRDTGRIYRILYGKNRSGSPPDLSSLSQAEWVTMLGSSNAWHWRTALRLLQEVELEPEILKTLQNLALAKVGESLVNLRAFWALATRPEAEMVAEHYLTEGDVPHRCWAVRWLIDHAESRPRLAEELVETARREKSPRVRLYLAGALQKLPLEQRADLAPAIGRDPADNTDHNLPLLIWYGIEELIADRPESGPDIFISMKLEKVREFIARRLFEQGAPGSEALSQILTHCLEAEDEAGLGLALDGMTAAAHSLDSAPVLPEWDRVESHVSVPGNADRLQQVLKLGALMGRESSLAELAARIGDTSLSEKQRQESLTRFFTIKPDLLGAQAAELSRDPALREALLPLLRHLPIEQSAPILFDLLPEAGVAVRAQIVEVLVSRIQGARLLVKALEEGTILPREVSALQARQLFSLEDASLTERLENAWGTIRSTREGLREQIVDWTTRMTPAELAQADLANGREVFSRACAACHKMFGEGGEMGPELTGSDRGNLTYLLDNIIDPSAVVPADAQAVLVTLTDGQIFTGVGGTRRDDQVRLRTATHRFSWDATEVREVRPLEMSLMPEGLLDTLSFEEARNLLAWLMRGQPVASSPEQPTHASETRTFPPCEAVVNVRHPPYNARGDGKTDDTEALQKALHDVMGQGKILYLPNGTYLVSDRLRYSKQNSRGEEAWGYNYIQGQSSKGTVVRLKDGTFTDPEDPNPILWGGGFGSADWFHNYIQDVTFDVGNDNAGAIGLQFYSNNSGALRRVRIVSEDGQGAVGLDLASDMNGPLLVRNLEVTGFDVGIQCGHSVNSQTFEHIRLIGQRTCALRNEGQSISVRGLYTNGAAPAVQTSGGLMALLEATLIGQGEAENLAAISAEGPFYARDLQVRNYREAIICQGDHAGAAGPKVDEFMSHRPTSPFPSPAASLRLPIKETPDVSWDDPKDWAIVDDFGADPNGKGDSSAAIQKAIDSGATTVFFPGKYGCQNPVKIRGNVRRVIGSGNYLEYERETPPTLIIEDGESPIVVIEHFSRIGSGIEIATERTVVCRSIEVGGAGIIRKGRGDLFLEDVCSDPWSNITLTQGNVWARQLNVENEGTHVTNDGGSLWILGFKTERGGTLIDTRGGGRTELFGNFSYTTTAGGLAPMFTNTDSAVFAFFNEISYSGNPFEILLRETRGGITKEVKRGDGGVSPYIGYSPR